MATYFICRTDEVPCSPVNQLQVSEIGVDDFAQIGITPATLATSVTLGFGLVFCFAILGWVTGSIVRQVRSI
ncbi:hypothetical protein ABE501_06695 [Comamonas testosteroni]